MGCATGLADRLPLNGALGTGRKGLPSGGGRAICHPYHRLERLRLVSGGSGRSATLSGSSRDSEATRPLVSLGSMPVTAAVASDCPSFSTEDARGESREQEILERQVGNWIRLV